MAQAEVAVTRNKLIQTSWLELTNDESVVKLSFLDNERLIVAKNGNVTEGKWEFIIDQDSLYIDIGKKELYDCYTVLDDFLVLKKDTTDGFSVFGNFSKYKQSNKELIQTSFSQLFERLQLKEASLTTEDKINIIQLYEIYNLLSFGGDKIRLKRLFDKFVYNNESGQRFKYQYASFFKIEIATHLSKSKFQQTDLVIACESLIRYNIVKPK